LMTRKRGNKGSWGEEDTKTKERKGPPQPSTRNNRKKTNTAPPTQKTPHPKNKKKKWGERNRILRHSVR